MVKKKLLIIGDGGHARSCIDVIENNKNFKIYGIISGSKKNVGKKIFNYKVIGTDKDLKKLKKKVKYAHVALGSIGGTFLREKLFNKLKKLKFSLPIIKSNKSHISKYAQIGEGTIIMHGAIINANSKIGYNCILNSNSLIEHDCEIGNHSQVSTGAILNGSVTLGSRSFIGSRSVVKNNCKLKSKTFLKMGTVYKG